MDRHSPSATNPLKRAADSLRAMRERHEERHRPSGFRFAFADRVDFLNGADWDALTNGRSIFLSRDLLRVIEGHGPENITPRYALIYRDRTPVAALAAQIVSLSGRNLQSLENREAKPAPKHPLMRILSPAAKAATANLNERVLVAGNLLSWGFHGIAFAADETPAALWPGVAEALYRIRRSEKLTGQTNFILVKDITELESGSDVLKRFSYRPLATEPNMALAVDPAWRNYDDYLAALDSKYRRNCKDQLKKLAAAGCTIEPFADLSSCSSRLHELYLAVHHNAPVRLMNIPETFLPALERTLGDNFRCTVIRRGREILGFITSLRDGDTAVGYYLGFDRAAAATGLPIYLRLLHATIGHAIDWGCSKLSLGRTALEPKATLGAKPEMMTSWMRHRVAPFNWMIRDLFSAVPHGEVPERNPFKAVRGSSAD